MEILFTLDAIWNEYQAYLRGLHPDPRDQELIHNLLVTTANTTGALSGTFPMILSQPPSTDWVRTGDVPAGWSLTLNIPDDVASHFGHAVPAPWVYREPEPVVSYADSVSQPVLPAPYTEQQAILPGVIPNDTPYPYTPGGTLLQIPEPENLQTVARMGLSFAPLLLLTIPFLLLRKRK
jgi:hypothetical protein